MANGKKLIPERLKNDAIVEALFEARFDTPTIPEIFFGRLADYAPWKEFEQRRLPAYEIPAPLRQADQNLRYYPVFELVDTKSARAVRIGQHVLSYHRLPPYVGWKKFAPELDQAIDALFSTTRGLTIRRLGLRYLNALRADVHGIASISELDVTVAVAGERVVGNVNLNFATHLSEDTDCTIRVATPEFVQGGVLPAKTSVVIDVDVFTREHFKTAESSAVTNWIEFAHTNEKEQFFGLLTPQTIQNLKES
jgi:uncharacterized protein (TIGR04255 family)